MANLIRNTQAPPTSPTYTPDVSVSPSQQQMQQSLEQNLVARETTKFYEDYFKTQQQTQLDAFAATVAKKMYSTPIDQASAAAADIQATCTAFNTQAQALRVTALTLAQVRERLDEQITRQVEACGPAAVGVLEQYIVKVGTELHSATTKRDETQAWLSALQVLLTTLDRDGESRFGNGSAGGGGFGARYTSPDVLRTTGASSTITEEILTVAEARVSQTSPPEAFGEETVASKSSRRHR